MGNLYVIAEVNIKNKNIRVCLAYKDDILVDLQVCKESDFSIGNVYSGIVSGVQGDGEAFFVDISPNLTGYVKALKTGDYVYVKKVTKKAYPAPGDIILVQYKTEAIKTKQPGFSAEIDIPGKYLVINSKNGSVSVSKKLDDDTRKILKNIVSESKSDEYGILIRTAAKDASIDQITSELDCNSDKYKNIISKLNTYPPYTCVYKSEPEYLRWLNDLYVTQDDRVVTNIHSIYDELQSVYSQTKFYDDDYPIEKLYGLTTVFDRLTAKVFHLKSGGTIVIEQTESLTAIDVNTAGCTFSKNKSKLDIFLKINREAAEEIIRQIILRNISGIIIVDFIDMPDESYNKELLNLMRKYAQSDKIGTNVVDITPLGLIEITRKKVKASLYEQLR